MIHEKENFGNSNEGDMREWDSNWFSMFYADDFVGNVDLTVESDCWGW